MDLNTQPIAKTAPDEQVSNVIRAHESSSVNPYEVRADIQQPVCTVDFSTDEIKWLNATVETGPATYYNSYYGKSWVLHWPGRSYIQVTSTLGPRNAQTKVFLDLIHLASLVNGKPDSPITILVNRQPVISAHNPNCGNYIKEQFDITDFVIDGENTIEIRLDQGASTNYWIQSLAIIES